MSTDVESTDEAPTTPAHLRYGGSSRVATTGAAAQLELFGNLDRPAVEFRGTIREPLRFREALSALYAIVGSDYRYQPKDRTAYLAYLRLKKETASQSIWQAQQAYFGWLLRNDPLLFCILDPVVSVHPDRLLLEVFSRDESGYACLAFARDAFDEIGAVQPGTTNIDFSEALFASVQQMRDYRKTELHIGSAGVRLKTDAEPGVLEKQIRVPDSWLRGFLQVQSAATLPLEHVQLAPMDLYNALRHLRMNGDRKGKRRGLRLELIPAQQPRIVLEPSETVIEATGPVFNGTAAKVVRVWGRRRLLLMKRLLPYVRSVDVYLLGSGLPSFWVFRAGDITLTLGLTGFTAANWSGALGFDLLLPRQITGGDALEKIIKYLAAGVWVATKEQIGKETGLKGSPLLEALQLGCQQGQLMFDLATQQYRYRPLVETKLDLTRLQYRNVREKVAHDLLTRRDAVKIVSANRIAAQGLELTGQVTVTEEKRDYRPQMLIADEGNLRRASCTCAQFRKQGLKAGPCVHLIALRLAWAVREAAAAKADDGVTFETRAFTQRDAGGENVVQISLERKKLKVRWGRAGQTMRLQSVRFNSEGETRSSYFQRLADLDAKGFLDAIAD